MNAQPPPAANGAVPFVLPSALSALAVHRQFIVCRFVPRGAGKTDKFPIDWRTDAVASAHDPAIWLDWQEAAAYAVMWGDGHGVGFVLTEACGLWFLDIDSCRVGDTWSPLARELLGRFNGAAVEISHSEQGLHIIGSGVAPLHRSKNVPLGIELYTDKRFVALTGTSAMGDAATRHDAALASVVAQYFPTDMVAGLVTGWTTEPCEAWRGPTDDDDLIRRALQSRSAGAAFGNRASFADLWEANADALARAYPDAQRSYDASSADSALAQHLAFWTGKNCERIRVLMHRSSLVREKWNRDDYLTRTILGVVARQSDVLADKPQPGASSAAKGGPWPDPKPIIAERLKPVPAFDPEALLPDVMRPWIMDEADRMPCPPDFIAAAAVVALGSIIGARCAIKPKALDSWLIVPNLWGGIVGDPSAKKSPAWGSALKPLDRIIAKAMDAHKVTLANYEVDKLAFDARTEAIKGRIKAAAKKPTKDDTANIARELHAHGEQAPVAPIVRRFKTNDSTVEKLGELLRENPAGLLVMRDELVGLLLSWDREGREGDRAFFLEAWNGDQNSDTDRIGRGHVHIDNLCLSIFGGIQPDKLTGYLEQATHALANDGLLQRFQVLVYPDACPWEYRDRAPNQRARDAVFKMFEVLADFNPISYGASPADSVNKFPAFSFDSGAQAVFIAWSENLHQKRIPNEEEPIIEQHLAKFDKLFPALALIFHLVECMATNTSGPVTAAAARRASAWCEYLEAHARRCYGLLKDGGTRAAQTLAAKLERGALGDGFTLRDVRRPGWRNLTGDSTIKAALDWLEEDGWLRSEETAGTGRPTRRYYVNPAVTGKGAGG